MKKNVLKMVLMVVLSLMIMLLPEIIGIYTNYVLICPIMTWGLRIVGFIGIIRGILILQK